MTDGTHEIEINHAVASPVDALVIRRVDSLEFDSIWLQKSDDIISDESTWCLDKINNDDIEYIKADSNFTSNEVKKRDAIVMANARKLIKSKVITTNRVLYRDLFGTGFTTAGMRCVNLGLNPDSNITDYNVMMEFLDV